MTLNLLFLGKMLSGEEDGLDDDPERTDVATGSFSGGNKSLMHFRSLVRSFCEDLAQFGRKTLFFFLYFIFCSFFCQPLSSALTAPLLHKWT